MTIQSAVNELHKGWKTQKVYKIHYLKDGREHQKTLNEEDVNDLLGAYLGGTVLQVKIETKTVGKSKFPSPEEV